MSDTTTRPVAFIDRDGDTWTPIGPSREVYRVTTCVCAVGDCLGAEGFLDDLRSRDIIVEELSEAPQDDATIVARLRARRAEALADLEESRGVNHTQFAVNQVLVEVLSRVLDGGDERG